MRSARASLVLAIGLLVICCPSLHAQVQPLGAGSGVAVTPDGGTEPDRLANTGGYGATFLIKNTGSVTRTFSIGCGYSEPVVCTGTDVTSLTLNPNQTLDVTAFYNVEGPGFGAVTVTATSGTIIDQGDYAVIVHAPGPSVVALRNHNGDTRDRALCLTSGAGEAAGVSCGDLFVVHSMPAYRTLGRDRTLTLHYNSGAAEGLFLLAADITRPATVTPPIKVQVLLTVGAATDSAEYGSHGAGEIRQVVLGRGLASQATGVYPLTLRVRNVYDSSMHDTTITSTALIVNRASSEFGRGWALLGIEQILLDPSDTTRRVRVTGDGSVWRYTKVNPGSNIFRAAAAAAPDSIIRFDTLCTPTCVKWYRRNLRHGASVTFDETGRHRITRSRVGQQTLFTWGQVGGQPRLISITVPPNATYNLHWRPATARLDSIVDPFGRALKVTVTGDLVTRLVQTTLFPTDDADTTQFEYQSGRLTRRVAESSAIPGGFTGTVYQYQNNARLTSVKIPVGATGTDTGVVTLTPWDEKGLAVAYTNQQAALSSVEGLPTRVDGPLTGLGDAADFWVDRFGGPVKIVQVGLNATTTLSRDSTVSLPALVTRVVYPNGRIARMSYNARGNLSQVRDSTSHLGAAGLPTKVTTYTYADVGTPDSPTRVTDALGRIVDYAYNALGLTDSVIDTRSLRTKFAYHVTGSLAGLVQNVANRSVPTWWESDQIEHTQDQVDAFTYDAVGNLKSWTSPVGVATAYQTTQAGAPTDVYDPLGYHRRWGRDGFNRVTSLTQFVARDSLTGVSPLGGCDTNQVVCTAVPAPFDPPSDFLTSLVSVYRQRDDGVDSVADPRGVWRRFGFDAAGQVTRETDDFGLTRFAYHNRAGLLDSTISRAGIKVRFRYDSIGRRTAMLLPTMPPRFATDDSVTSDSVSYVYDIMGNILIAKNRVGTITRTYFGDGSLQSKVTVYDAAPTLKDSVYYGYDAAGARTRMVRVQGTNVDSVRYFYGAVTGDLDSMRVWWGAPVNASRLITFTWDLLGRRRRVTYPNGMTAEFRYDGSGTMRRLISRNRGFTGGINDRFHFDFENDQVDPAGRILHQDVICLGWGDTADDPFGNPCGSDTQAATTNEYNLFGMLTKQTRVGVGSGTVIDTRRYDRSGNLSYQHSSPSNIAWQYTHVTHAGGRASNVLLSAVNNLGMPWNFAYDNELARRSETRGTPPQAYARYWHDALGRTSGVTKSGGTMTFGPNRCRYDPDGQLAKPCENGSPRLVFDGANVAGTLSTVDWRFIPGPGLDDPLIGLHRPTVGPAQEYYWVTDGRGRQFAVATPDGSLSASQINQLQVNGGVYAGGTGSSYSYGASRFGTPDIPTMSFFRNRVYDQESGRFTQEDPIGLAGGLNLYGFAAGNPVNFADPFGLTADTLEARGATAEKLLKREYLADPRFAKMVDALRSSPRNFVLVSSDVDAEVRARFAEWPGQAFHVGGQNAIALEQFPELAPYYDRNTSGIAVFSVDSRNPAKGMKHELAHVMGIHETGRAYRHGQGNKTLTHFPPP
jgi:RHS repeat-associated protein